MGILNVTPDSFSDGGQFFSPEQALRQAELMIAAGVDIIDIGGESSRPGSLEVPPEEQIRRIQPVLETLCASHDVMVSIDTRSSDVARVAFQAGAHILNDISACSHDEKILGLLREYGAGVVLMHMQGLPSHMQDNPCYTSVVEEVSLYLEQRVKVLLAAGISRSQICLDPGIGFGKSLSHNIALVQGVGIMKELGYPLLIGLSRKNFIGTITGKSSEQDRLGGSLGAMAYALLQGANIVRVHDVEESVEVAKMMDVLKHKKEKEPLCQV